MEHESPSPFYDELKGAQDFLLLFPADNDRVGPQWTSTGDLVSVPGAPLEEEEIEAVWLGGNRYRLAQQCAGPFSTLELHWGDEFLAERSDDGTLTLTKVIVPRRFRHFRFITTPGSMRGSPTEAVVHQVGGGWEAVAGGVLTITVPASRMDEFRAALVAAGLSPRGFEFDEDV